MAHRIPFNKPFIVGQEIDNVARAVLAGQTSGDGRFSEHCQDLMVARFGARRALLTPSCTAALEIAALLADIEPGDQVILPSYTFVSTANAFFLRGAELVFADIRPDTLNLDETLLDGLVGPRTKAIVPVHYAGVGCEMAAIQRVADRVGALVIEDAAQGVNARYRGRHLGTLGDMGTYSFHETKNIMCGEGGALLVNRQDLVSRAEIIRQKGTNRSRFLRGLVDKYSWVDLGSSYALSDLLAAFLHAQLQHVDEITQVRRGHFEAYMENLAGLAEDGLIRLPVIPEYCTPNYHMVYILVADLATRSGLIEHLSARGIGAVFHYVPLHTSPVGRRLGHRAGQLPVTEDVADRLVRLPLYHEITRAEIDEVSDQVRAFLKGTRSGVDATVVALR